MYFLWCAIIGIIAGWLAGNSLKGYGYGPLMDILMGVAGALAAGFMLRSASLSNWGATLAATLGAVTLTIFTAFVSGKRRFA